MIDVASSANNDSKATKFIRERNRFLSQALQSFPKFCGLLTIVPKSGARQRFSLNDIQKAFNKARTARDIVLKPRQIGFTTLEQARDVWHFLTVPGARVVTTCQSMTDGSPKKLLSINYRGFFDSLRALGLQLNFRTESTHEWVLADRDATLRIIEAGASEAAASKKGRAGTITRLHLTETAFYEYAEDTLNALFECVPSPEHGSEIVNESTPNGAAGTYYAQWVAAVERRNGYTPHFFPWFQQAEYRTALEPGETVVPQNDRERSLSPEQIKWYRQKIALKGGDLTLQEYPNDPDTCFLVSGRSFFDMGVTAALLAETRLPVETLPYKRHGADGTLRIWHHPEPGKQYVVALDVSEGTGRYGTVGADPNDKTEGDAATGLVFERETGRHMATLWGQFKPVELARASVGIAIRYNHAVIAPERNNHGHACLVALELEHHYPNIFRDMDGKLGWLSTEASRTPALDNLEEAHRNGHFKTLDRELLREIRTFVVNKNGKAEAAPGSHDDLVLGAAIGWNVICRQRTIYDVRNLPPA